MIIADVKFARPKSMKPQRLMFQDAQMPRVGEIVRLHKGRYVVKQVVHRFVYMDKVAGALEDQKYFTDMPTIEITLEYTR